MPCARHNVLRSVLIANRGEIAARIARTCRRLGIRCVAVHSEADRGAPHTPLADESVENGPPPVAESHVAIPRVVEAARWTGCEAVRPDDGLVSENALFIAMVEEAALAFVGPAAGTVARMGGKQRTRSFAREVVFPVVPGLDDDPDNEAATLQRDVSFGFPVLVKTAAGSA